MAEPGSVLGGRYRLDQVLGQGGMATTFRATDRELGREVAVKVLRAEFGADAEFVGRFRHEAQAAAALDHANIVPVYDFGTDPAGPYIVMEQLAGGDLSAVLGERGPLPPTAVARTGQQVAEALSAAHAAGLVHRDIKPSNILLSPDGRVQVADFGIAQAAVNASATSTGITLGSVLYCSPEQARGDAAAPASDIYSLGLVMYEMLTGQRAFSGDSPAAVAVARLSGPVPSPMAIRADVPPSLDVLVRWCLQPEPAARPEASALSAVLARFVTDPAGAAAYATASGVATASGLAYAGGFPPGLMPVDHLPTATTGGLSGDDPDRSGSGPWTWLAAGLGLLVIIASGILLFLLLGGIGDGPASPSPSPSPTVAIELVKTPKFVGRLESPAERLAAERGLVLAKNYIETGEYEAGRIIDQLPEQGVDVTIGTSVQVTVATRAETVVVPDVSGIIESKAIEQIEGAGLTVGARFSAVDALPAGYVIATEPRAGASMTRGSTVDYVTSLGQVSGSTPRPPWTPKLTAEPDQTSQLTLALGTPEPAVTFDPAGGSTPETTPVASAQPTPETSPWASPLSTPSPFPSQALMLVGDFLCLDLGTARSQLEAAGLLVGATIPSGDPAADDTWIIHDQLPKAGDHVPVGSAVDLVLMEPLAPCPAG